VALPLAANGGRQVKYASGLDLLRQTPEFVAEVRTKRLDGSSARFTAILRSSTAAATRTWKRSSANVEYLRQISAQRELEAAAAQSPIFAASDEGDDHDAGPDARLHQKGLVKPRILTTLGPDLSLHLSSPG